ncbi:MAG TPA: TonB-dependent receptor [Steroidobacteraceae bacterium]|nr:TonB-dependent receptor [Steroidobacteraceae bacterium]
MYRFCVAVVGYLCGFGMLSNFAHAQSAAPETLAMPEIIVTAQKRSENVNSVPISISVLTNQDLVTSGVTGTEQLQLATPGLVFGDTNGFAQPYIRGIGTDLISPGQESPVGFYLDGVYLPFTSSLVQEFGDIARVEVLKGPQGTLYGRNTTGGAVNIITRDPGQAFTADANVMAGNLGYAKGTAYVAGGIADGLAGSIAGVYTIHNGFFDVLNTGQRLDTLNQYGVRTKLKDVVSDDWNIVFSGDYTHKNDSSDSVFTALIGSDLGLPRSVGPSFVPRDTYTDLVPHPHRIATDYGANLTVHGHLPFADLTSITGFRDDYLLSSADGDSTSLPLLAYQSALSSQSLTQEFQLASADSSPLQWLAGAFLLKGSGAFGPVDVWAGMPATGVPNAGLLLGRTRITSYALFGQASYAMTDSFKVIAGLRSSYERRSLTTQTNFATDFLDPATRAAAGLPPLDGSKRSTSTDPKVTLQYEHSGQLVYATYSTGFKSGSYNLISVTGPGPLEPEKIKAYEVGGKHDLPVLSAHLDWALFYYKYRNIQVNIQDPGVGGVVAAQNAASTKDKGADLDLTVPIVNTLSATVGLEYLDARYDTFPNASVPNIVDGELGTVTPIGATKSVNASGNRAMRAPLLTSTFKVKWLVPTAVGDVTSTATWYHNSGFFFDAGDEISQKAYNIVNLNVQYAPPGGRWTVSAWANNLTNETVIAGINASPYVLTAGYNDPRLFGLGASIHF